MWQAKARAYEMGTLLFGKNMNTLKSKQQIQQRYLKCCWLFWAVKPLGNTRILVVLNKCVQYLPIHILPNELEKFWHLQKCCSQELTFSVVHATIKWPLVFQNSYIWMFSLCQMYSGRIQQHNYSWTMCTGYSQIEHKNLFKRLQDLFCEKLQQNKNNHNFKNLFPEVCIMRWIAL